VIDFALIGLKKQKEKRPSEAENEKRMKETGTDKTRKSANSEPRMISLPWRQNR
jgi:hypothetical protein